MAAGLFGAYASSLHQLPYGYELPAAGRRPASAFRERGARARGQRGPGAAVRPHVFALGTVFWLPPESRKCY